MNKEKLFAEQVLREIETDRVKTKSQIDKLKRELCVKYKLSEAPTNPDILKYATDEQITKFSQIMGIKPTRTISGVAVITVSTKPGFCGGRCIYCPPMTKTVPKSYLPTEPAIQRAKRNQFDPFKQVQDRLNQYRIMGHPTDKIEIIVLGGSFTALDKTYQEEFIKGIYEGLNGKRAKTLEEAKKINETSKHRCIGLTIETRPDYCMETHIDDLLKYGCTRSELGIQSIYNDVLDRVKRDHHVEETIKSIQLCKDACFKIIGHIMPFLPGSDFKRDLDMFKEIFTNPDFAVDEFKIYPCVVVPNTELYEQWKRGEYKPPTLEETIDLIVEMKKIAPPWVRFRRVFRDIPAPDIAAGPRKSNLRELALEKLKKQGYRCRCTRCREPGHAKRLYGVEPDVENIKIVRRNYDASGDKEIFLSFEDTKNDILIALLRLRIPSEKAHRKEINIKSTALIREIHTYGKLVPLEKRFDTEWQHRGYGGELLKEAERISKEEFDMKKILAISGVGVKQWFMKHGYDYDGPYVSKLL